MAGRMGTDWEVGWLCSTVQRVLKSEGRRNPEVPRRPRAVRRVGEGSARGLRAIVIDGVV